jgi:hypothetical protein
MMSLRVEYAFKSASFKFKQEAALTFVLLGTVRRELSLTTIESSKILSCFRVVLK